MKSVFTITLFCFCVFAQLAIAQIKDPEIKKNGKVTNYHQNNKIESTGKYRKSLKVGEWKYYREDGSLEKVENYEKGVLHGTAVQFNTNTNKSVEHIYKYGKVTEQVQYNAKGEPRLKMIYKPDNVYTEINYGDYRAIFEINYKDSVKHGLYMEWYKDNPSQLKKEGYLKFNQQDSLWKSWYANGILEQEIFYRNGRLEGVAIQYYQNGNKKHEAKYSDSKLEGIARDWYYDGTPKKYGKYVSGQKDSIHVNWNENGDKTETNYSNGIKMGVEKTWSNAGLLIWEVSYLYNQINGTAKTWHKNGKPYVEAAYDTGSLNGKYIEYHPNGNTKETGLFEYNRKNGDWKYFDTNSNIIIIESYKGNDLFSKTIYYQNGKKKEHIEYSGYTTKLHYEWDESGNLNKKPIKPYNAPMIEQMPDNNEFNNVLQSAEQMPEFPGRMDSLTKYLNRNLQYPRFAAKNGVQGKVYIEFIVRKDASVTDARVIKGLGYGLDEEALRVIKLMPKWIPGKHNGKPVDVRMNIPVSFELK